MMKNQIALLLLCCGVIAGATTGHGQESTAGMAVGPAFVEPPSTEQHYPPLGNTDVLSINAYAFEAYSQSGNFAVAVFGAQRYCQGVLCSLEGPVELPDGAVISRIELDAYDVGSFNVSATFLRCPLGQSGCTGVASTATTGTPGQTQVGADFSVNEVVNNQAASYVVQVRLGDNDDTRFNAVRLVYEPPNPPLHFQTMSINAFAFEPYDVDARYSISPDVARRHGDGNPCLAIAPVELPSGTVISRLELDGYDIGSGSVVVELGRCSHSSTVCQSMAYLETTGTPGTTVIGVDLPTPVTIDNSLYSYMLQADLGTSDQTQLGSARLIVEFPPGPLAHDRLSTNAFAYEPYDQTGRAVLDAAGPMRYCNGSQCNPIAPVELPSGAWVTGLDLSAYDMNAGDDVTAFFSRCPLQGQFCDAVAGVATNGTPGSTGVTVNIQPPEYIDNRNYSYGIQVSMGPDGSTGFYSTRLVVDLETVFGDGFDWGDTTRWTATMP